MKTEKLNFFWVGMIFLFLSPFFLLPRNAWSKKSTPSPWQWETATGDWAGLKPKLKGHGINLGFVYTGEVIANLEGGLQKDADYLHNFDLTLEVDLENLLGWVGASIFIYGIGQ